MFCQEAGEKKSVVPEEGSYVSALMGEEKHHLLWLSWIIKAIIATICQYLDNSYALVLISFKNLLA